MSRFNIQRKIGSRRLPNTTSLLDVSQSSLREIGLFNLALPRMCEYKLTDLS